MKKRKKETGKFTNLVCSFVSRGRGRVVFGWKEDETLGLPNVQERRMESGVVLLSGEKNKTHQVKRSGGGGRRSAPGNLTARKPWGKGGSKRNK